MRIYHDAGHLTVKQFTAEAADNDNDDYTFILSSTAMPVAVQPISPVKQQFAVTNNACSSSAS